MSPTPRRPRSSSRAHSSDTPHPRIDRERLRAAVRGLDRVSLLELLDRALDAIPPGRLGAVAGDRIPLDALEPDSDLLGQIERFCEASRRGEYYQGFAVNSKNCTEKSLGTQRWIAECERLFGSCLSNAKRLGPAQTRKALTPLLDLLRSVDEGSIEIVFWADEGGSYEVGVDWEEVLPLWFRSLAATADPAEYAREAVRAIDDFVHYDRVAYLRKARSAASAAQRKALEES